MPDVPAPNLGDIMGICKLLDATALIYTNLVRRNADPQNPSQPRLRIVGGQLTRLPHKVFFHDLVGPSFMKARRLGYRGTYQRWGELLREAIFRGPQTDSIKSSI